MDDCREAFTPSRCWLPPIATQEIPTLRNRENAWSEFMNMRWAAPDCTSCDVERERGATVCGDCGYPIEQGKETFWDRVRA